MGLNNEKGVFPAFLKPPSFEFNNGENEELKAFYEEKLPDTRARGVPWTIAFSVGEKVDLYNENFWKLYVSALGMDDDMSLRKIEYRARMKHEHPLTEFLTVEFHQRNGSLGELLEVLLTKHQYNILKVIRPLVEECLNEGSNNSSGSLCGNDAKEEGTIHISVPIGNNVTVSVNNLSSLDNPKNIRYCKEIPDAKKECDAHGEKYTRNKIQNEVPGWSATLPTTAPKEFASPYPSSSISSSSSNSDNCMPPSCSSSFGTNGHMSDASACSSSIFSQSSSNSNNWTSLQSGLSSSCGFRNIFLSLSSVPDLSSQCVKMPVVETIHNPIPIYSQQSAIFVFITHTVADFQIAETVAERLSEFGIVGVTQYRLRHLLFVHHEDVVNKLVRDIDFIMPVVSESYMNEISVPDDIVNCSTQRLTVKNIFSALQSYFFSCASQNWKIRPVVPPGTSPGLAREKQELRSALCLWDEWNYLGDMLTKTARL